MSNESNPPPQFPDISFREFFERFPDVVLGDTKILDLINFSRVSEVIYDKLKDFLEEQLRDGLKRGQDEVLEYIEEHADKRYQETYNEHYECTVDAVRRARQEIEQDEITLGIVEVLMTYGHNFRQYSNRQIPTSATIGPPPNPGEVDVDIDFGIKLNLPSFSDLRDGGSEWWSEYCEDTRENILHPIKKVEIKGEVEVENTKIKLETYIENPGGLIFKDRLPEDKQNYKIGANAKFEGIPGLEATLGGAYGNNGLEGNAGLNVQISDRWSFRGGCSVSRRNVQGAGFFACEF